MRILAAILIGTLSLATAPLASRHWTGTTDGLWSKASNWGGTAPVANDDLIFDNATNVNPTTSDFPAGTGFNSLTFDATGNTFSLGGNSVALGAGGITQVSGSTINSFLPFTLAASQTWTTAAAGGFFLNPSSSLDLGANTLNVAGTGDLNITNTTIGSGPINLNGGTLTIRSHLDSTGTLTVGNGALLNLVTPDTVAPSIVVNSGGHVTVPNGSSTLMTRPLALNAGSFFDVGINGTSVPNFSRITANNNITIAGNLSVTNNISAPLGTTYGILTAQGIGHTVSGTFTGLPNGATFIANGQTFQITYSATAVNLMIITTTTTSLASSLNPSNFGDAVTFTATVSPSATGSVTLFDGLTNLGSASLNGSSQTAFGISSLSPGPHSMSAVYNGNATLGISTGTLTQQVNASVPTMREWMLIALGGMLAAFAAASLRRRRRGTGANFL